ncbi:MAG: Maf family protein, partial [Clostridia bacterium]|nr:Maf family protein [Clostridia bacterium]
MKSQIILASSSPRRIEMLQSNGIMPIIIPSNADETLPMELSMEQSVMYLALKKALNVEKLFLADQADAPANYVVIAADTIVYKNSAIGKPSDRHDAE